LFAEYTTKLNASKEPPAKKPKLDEHSTAQPKFIQFSLPTLSERSTKWPDDHPAVQRIDKAIIDLIIVDMLPYAILEGDAFKRLNFADTAATRRCEPKSEKYFRTTVMPATYEKVASRVRGLLSRVDYVFYDGWLEQCIKILLSAEIHRSFSAPVHAREGHIGGDGIGRGPHRRISGFQADRGHAIQTWNLDGKVHMELRDNAPNIACAMRIAKVESFGYMAHTLQLVLHDALFSQTTVTFLIE